MISRNVTATEAARNLADFVNRVRYRGEEFIIEKGGEAVARLSPVRPAPSGTIGDLVRLAQRLGQDPEFADELERIIGQDNESGPPGDPWAR